MRDRTIFVATSSVLSEYDGRPLYIHQGLTTVRAGHPLLETHDRLFEPLRPTFEYDPVTEQDTPDEPPVQEAAAESEGDAPTGTEDDGDAPVAPEPHAKDVRAWAVENGIEVPARGKLPTEVVGAYKAAHTEA